jgi:uncharacterized protein
MRTNLPALVLAGAAVLAASCRTNRPHENYAVFERGSGGLPAGAGGGASVGATGTLGGSAALGGDTSFGGDGDSGGSSSAGGGSANIASGGADTAAVGGDSRDHCDAPTAWAGSFTRAKLRASAAACLEYHSCRFQGAAEAMTASVRLLVDEPNAETLDTARRRLLTALDEWSELEVMQFGPVASASATSGKDLYQGLGIREVLYSWPQVSRCRVDEQVASQKYALFGMEGVLTSARGLVGLETLLFYEGLDTACSHNSTTFDTWALLTEQEIGERRRAYALTLTQDVSAQVENLRKLWSPSGGNFQETFVSASGYPDEQEAMNVLGWAMIYVEREVKDWKLGIPAGYTDGAPVSGPETEFAGEQTALLKANLRGFRAIFEGCGSNYTGLGFDDWLKEAGHAGLANDIVTAAHGAERVLADLPKFSEASPQQVESAYGAVKALTDLLKNDLFGTGSALNLKLPAGVEGDTD